MGWFSEDSDQAQAYDQVTGAETDEHKSSLSHELIAGAASYEAMKAYEKHCEKNGKPASHDEAKEIMAGFAGAFADKIFESKGLDFIDKEKAKFEAQKQAKESLSQYGEY